MANNYNYKTKDSIKASDITTTPIFIYDSLFENIPITIASLFDSNTNTTTTNRNIVSTSIYGQSNTRFSSSTYYKNSVSGATNGGLLNYGKVNYFSVDNVAVQQYKYLGSPVMQAGTFTISANTGISTVSFPSFLNTPIVVVCPTGTGDLPQIISCSIYSITTSQFTAISVYKDGTNNNDGGGFYYNINSQLPGTFNYIAVDNTAILAYKISDGPIINCGTFTTVNGTATVTLGFTTGTVKVFCSPTGNYGTTMITCTITAVSTSQFSVCAFFKDGRGGQRGGGIYNGPFNYIAVTTV